jgi:glycosyltransferase involved in cell wall biosynthesis
MQNSICFVGLDNYPVLNPDYGDRYFGGESVQQTLLARAFRDLGLDVSMVVLDYGQPDGEVIEGIRVWRTYREGAGIPVFRFVHPKATSIFSALNKSASDIYFQSCSGMLTGMVAMFCKQNKRQFVYRVASDADCVKELPLVRYGRDRCLYKYGLKRADLVSAQSVYQATLLEKNFSRSSTVIDMAVGIPESPEGRPIDVDVLWVNNLRPLKRPEHLLRLAKALPKYRFVMVGGAVPGNEKFYGEIAREAAGIPNLEFVGAVPFHKVTEFFLRSRLFVNTSEIEGFPNSMLQAWACGLPVVSYFDPDGINKKGKLGHSPKDLEDMIVSVRGFLENPGMRGAVGSRARRFVATHYSPESVAKAYLEGLAVRRTETRG